MKKLVLMMVMLIAGVSLSACGKKSGEIGEGDLPTNEPIITEEPVSTEEPAPTEDPHIGEALSKLTGEYVPEKVAKRRPYAIMINNRSEERRVGKEC